MKKLDWDVYRHDINRCRMTTYNVFNHGGFIEDVKKHLKTCKTREELAEGLKRSAMYYFWSKSEWEIILSPWIGHGEPVKIDVYDQLRLNWDVFVDCVWDRKKAE